MHKGAVMGRAWRPKHRHRCDSCGWVGKRSKYPRPCPRCGHWRPLPDKESKK